MSFNSRLAVGTVLAFALVSVAGCATRQTTLHPSFGAALSEDLAAQIANPDANYATRPAPLGDGTRAALAYGRYRDGKVTKPTASASEVGESAANGASPGAPGAPGSPGLP